MQPDFLPLMARSSRLNSEIQISMSFFRRVIEDEIKRRSSAYIIIDKQLKPIRQPRPLFSTAIITSFTKIAKKLEIILHPVEHQPATYICLMKSCTMQCSSRKILLDAFNFLDQIKLVRGPNTRTHTLDLTLQWPRPATVEIFLFHPEILAVVAGIVVPIKLVGPNTAVFGIRTIFNKWSDICNDSSSKDECIT